MMALSWFSCSVKCFQCFHWGCAGDLAPIQTSWGKASLLSSRQRLGTSYYPNLKCLPQVAEGQGVATTVIQHPLWLPTRGLCQRPN